MALIAYSTGDQDNPGFIEKVKQVVFPDLEPENLATVHNHYIQNGLILAQKHVPCLRSNNVNYYDKDDVVINCDTAYFAGPANARIQAVYAYKPGTVCERFHFSQSVPAAIMCHQEAWANCHEQDDCEQNLSGEAFCEQETDDEATVFEADFKCASDRIFAHTADDYIYLAPRFPCDYSLVVHWEGMKRKWSSSDLLPDDEDLVGLIATFVQAERALRNDRDLQLHKELFELPMPGKSGGRFWQQLEHLQHLCREKVRIRRTANCAEGGGLGGFDAELVEFDNSALSGFVPIAPPNCTTPTVSLTASDTSITEGDTITLTYETSGLPDCEESTVQLLVGETVIETLEINVSGTVQVSPTEDTTYTLRATTLCNPTTGPGTTNPGGTTPPPPIVVETTTTIDVDPVVPPPPDDECELTEGVEVETAGDTFQATDCPGTHVYGGFAFTVGDEDLVVSHLGRYVIAGNTEPHRVFIFDATLGGFLNGQFGEVTVVTNGQPANAIAYTALTTPVVLAAGRSYSIYSEENCDGDSFKGWLTPNTIEAVDGITVNHWVDDTEAGDTPNESLSLPGFKFCATGIGGVPQNAESDHIISINICKTCETEKTGAAAVGNDGDIWVVYDPKSTIEPDLTPTSLNWADGSAVMGSVSGQSTLVANHPGTGTNGMWIGTGTTGHADPMMEEAARINDFPDVSQLRFVNLPTGTYDLIVYGPGGQLKVRTKIGGGAYSAYKTGVLSENFEGDFSNNINFVHFGGLVITDSTINLILELAESPVGDSQICGLQLIKRA